MLSGSEPAVTAGSGVGTAVVERPIDEEHSHFSENGHVHDSSANGHRSRGSVGEDPAFDELADLVGRTDLPEGAEDLADSPVVIRTKDHTATPMTIDQALYEMELVGHDFYLFVDAACGKPSVVYRRRGWNYGVIRLAVEQEAAAVPS